MKPLVINHNFELSSVEDDNKEISLICGIRCELVEPDDELTFLVEVKKYNPPHHAVHVINHSDPRYSDMGDDEEADFNIYLYVGGIKFEVVDERIINDARLIDKIMHAIRNQFMIENHYVYKGAVNE